MKRDNRFPRSAFEKSKKNKKKSLEVSYFRNVNYIQHLCQVPFDQMRETEKYCEEF